MEDKIKKLEQELQKLKDKEVLYLKRKEELEIFKSTFDIKNFFEDKLFWVENGRYIEFLEFEQLDILKESPMGLFLLLNTKKYNSLALNFNKEIEGNDFNIYIEDKKTKIQRVNNHTSWWNDYILIEIKDNEIKNIKLVNRCEINEIHAFCETGIFRKDGKKLNIWSKKHTLKDIKKIYAKSYNQLYLVTKDLFQGEDTNINFDDDKQLVINPDYENIIRKLKSKIPDFNDIKMLESVSLYYFYDDNCQLSNLETYISNPDKGITFEVVGLGGDSDYEPYITRFELEWVKINWKQILYPIRNKLKSVLKTAEQLEQLCITKDEWDIHYNSYFHDSYFQSISLGNTLIQMINNVIQKNLK